MISFYLPTKTNIAYKNISKLAGCLHIACFKSLAQLFSFVIHSWGLIQGDPSPIPNFLSSYIMIDPLFIHHERTSGLTSHFNAPYDITFLTLKGLDHCERIFLGDNLNIELNIKTSSPSLNPLFRIKLNVISLFFLCIVSCFHTHPILNLLTHSNVISFFHRYP